jgi:putative tryptophan/tyrosine transport system substrate-binding protein
MRRRDFLSLLGGTAALWSATARTQQPGMSVIGFLTMRAPGEDLHLLAGFRQGLKEAGFVEGQNVVIEFRFAEHRTDRLPALAAELVQRQVDAITANGPGARAAWMATRTIPIVFVAGFDPVEAGLAASLSRPGGNATGISVFDVRLGSKRLELMQELFPAETAFAVLVNQTDPARAKEILQDLETAARDLKVELHVLNAGTDRELEAAFAKAVELKAPGLVISGDSFYTSRSKQLAVLALRHRLPAVFGWREFAVAGGLMTYGTSLTNGFRQAGVYIGRILKGENPADLPVLQPTEFEFVINLKTARAFGLEIPPTLLVRADELIE